MCDMTRHVLQNSGMFEIALRAQSVYLLKNSDLFKNEITNHQKLKVINKGLMF